jgi:hypothetical protein
VIRRDNPLARLRRANPVPDADVPFADSPTARALMERIVRTEPTVPEAVSARRWKPRRAFLVLVPIAILALAAAGFSIYRSAGEPLVIACHATMARHGSTVMAPGPGDPVQACTSLWRPGGELNPRDELSLPLLEACILNGADHVFPHPERVDACDTLGLRHAAAPNRHEANEAAAAARVEDALAKEFLANCDTRDRGMAIARDALQGEGLTDWIVKLGDRPFTASEPCASQSIDVAARTVLIVPVRQLTNP